MLSLQYESGPSLRPGGFIVLMVLAVSKLVQAIGDKSGPAGGPEALDAPAQQVLEYDSEVNHKWGVSDEYNGGISKGLTTPLRAGRTVRRYCATVLPEQRMRNRLS